MLENRRDTPKRVAQYSKRGFDPTYIEDDRVDRERELILLTRVQEELDFKKSLLWIGFLGDIDVLETEEFDEDVATSVIAQQNTAYDCYNIPRMVDLTTRGMRMLFEKIGQQGNLITEAS